MPLVRRLLAPFARTRRYAHGPCAGFIGWRAFAGIVVAFEDASGALLYRW